jgi:hypothetical protein
VNCEHEPKDMKPTDDDGWWECPCEYRTFVPPGRLLGWLRKRRRAREARS